LDQDPQCKQFDRHEVSLVQEDLPDSKGRRIIISVDDAPVIETTEPAGWDPGAGSSDLGGHDRVKQIPTDGPLVLLRRCFMVRQPGGSSATPQGPSSGILLWIEKSQGRLAAQVE